MSWRDFSKVDAPHQHKSSVIAGLVPATHSSACPDAMSLREEKLYAVYLLASKPYGTLYIGVTGDLVTRITQHRSGEIPGFTKRYNVKTLMWFEYFGEIDSAIRREKTMKKWPRDWKVNLVERDNPYWQDLYPSLVGISTFR